MFGSDRINPLLIGSVKTIAGHAEISSGMVSLLQVLAVLRTGIIPATIYSEPIDYSLSGIGENILKVRI